ncbi:MAG: hypothetical protein DCF15_03585 [Phormidesmis priestleyi]|uniref:Uncharacterized protein n=1 Tax=Phormidesmis priestleyi TaxID=268141 RepID=A0A2W4XQ63_9CYAN|nr:MAG: hypothetical protein DCF15_03585 [Phormidesmis priestleyi]
MQPDVYLFIKFRHNLAGFYCFDAGGLIWKIARLDATENAARKAASQHQRPLIATNRSLFL